MTETLKKRGRPPKENLKPIAEFTEQQIKEMAFDEIIETDMLLKDAYRLGLVLENSSVQDIITEQVDKKISKLEADYAARIKEIDEMKQFYAQKLEKKKQAGDMGIADFMQKSGLTNKEFVKELISSSVQPQHARYLRDEHFNYRKNGKLDRAQIWKLIREGEANARSR